MFKFLIGGKVNLNVSIERPSGVYFPGDTIHAKVSLSSDKEMKFQEGRLVLLNQEKYKCYTSGEDGNESYWVSNTQEVMRQVFLGATTLSQGSAQGFEFEMQIPPTAPPTYSGTIVQVKWLVKATLDRKLAGDINSEVPLMVLVAPDGEQTPGQFGQSNEPNNALLSLDLPGSTGVAGETIQGTLLVTPQKSFDASEVRIELEKTEDVPRDLGNKKVEVVKVQVAGKVKFSVGETLRFPFQLQVPQTYCPSCKTQNWSVTWKIKGILERSMRKDPFVEQIIEVYSGRLS